VTRQAATLLLGMMVSVAACGPKARTVADSHPTLATSPADSLARIETRQLEARPRLTLIARGGDPHAVLALAVVTGDDPFASVALAALLEHRMRAAGFDAEASAHRGSLRLTMAAADADKAEEAVDALRSAFATSVAAGDPALELAGRRIAALKRHPLDDVALVPLAACSGQLGVVGNASPPKLTGTGGASRLDGWRRTMLLAGRSSLAAVGEDSVIRSAADALAAGSAWPRGAATAWPWPAADNHGSYRSSAIAEGEHRLELGIHLADARHAQSAVRRAAAHSPLSAKLATIAPAWQLLRASASAMPVGGCVRLTLAPSVEAAAEPSEFAASARRAVSLVARELTLEASRDRGAFDVAGSILEAGDASVAAARAAWWALTTPTEKPLRIASALGVSALGRDTRDDDPLGAAYRAAMQARPTESATDPLLESRTRLEQGQGSLWLLVGSPCAIRQEGGWDAGRAALGAMLAASNASPLDGVTIEPWVGPDGVGIVAHAAVRSADEKPDALARRVAEAAARALTAPGNHASFARAQQGVLAALRGPRHRLAVHAAKRLAPERLSWLLPFGEEPRQAAATLGSVGDAWRSLLRSPLRLAVLANATEAQASTATKVIDGWLPVEAKHAPCQDAAGAPALQPGRQELAGDSAPFAAAVAARLPASALPAARLAEAVLSLDDGPLAKALDGKTHRWSVKLIGGSVMGALIVELRAPDTTLRAAESAAAAALSALGKTDLSPALVDQARAKLEREQLRRRRDPRERLVDLWLGRDDAAGPSLDGAALRAALAPHVKASRLVIVAPQQPAQDNP
jgi:hypothetical protein